MTETINNFQINVAVTVTFQRIADTLVSAFEGGSNYWYLIEEEIAPAPDKLYPWDIKTGEQVWGPYQYPLSEGGAVIISVLDTEEGDDHHNKKFRLDLEAINKGLEVMANKFPRHFADMINENGDATTGDVLLQCCLFGDLIYG